MLVIVALLRSQRDYHLKCNAATKQLTLWPQTIIQDIAVRLVFIVSPDIIIGIALRENLS